MAWTCVANGAGAYLYITTTGTMDKNMNEHFLLLSGFYVVLCQSP